MTCAVLNFKPATRNALEGPICIADTISMLRFAALFAWILSTPVLSQAETQGVTVFAAASLRGALEDIASGFDGEVRLSYGGSGTMARQIAAGAPADVVVLANMQWMDWLLDQGAPFTQDPVTVAQNALVLVAPTGAAPLGSLQDIPARLSNGRLAMGQRDAVPAGIYARQWLQATALWGDVMARLAETDNVRAALALVARGEAPLGVVYASDAQAEDRVEVVWQIRADQHDLIAYPALAVTPAGVSFVARLTRPDAAQTFAAHGFQPVAK